MDYVLSRNIDKNIIYYGIYNTEVEILDESDTLCSIRQKYFETGLKQKNRNTFKTLSETYRYSYCIEDGRVLKWKKILGNQQIERVIETPDGYYVETFDYEKRPVKRAYFNTHHIWQKTEFYSDSDRFMPLYVLTGSFEGEKPVIVRTTQSKHSDTLYPFNITLDKTLTDKLNILTEEPQIFCRTSEGNFYFCTKSECEIRHNALEKMLSRENDGINTEPVFESAKEPSAFVINSEKLDEDLENSENSDFNLSKSEEIHIESAQKAENNIDIISQFKNQENAEKVLSDKIYPKFEADKKLSDDEKQTDNTFEIAQTDEKSEQPLIQEIAEIEEAKEQPNENEEKIVSSQKDAFEMTNEDDEENTNESADEKEIKMPSSDILYEKAEITQPRATSCIFACECPYETIDKQIIESAGKQYFYFGELKDGKRNGRGRTAMKNGETAYEGDYLDDKRDGFGVYYYKSGKLCYTGNWKRNKRNALGIAFSPIDGSAYIGEWNNDNSVGVGASFDQKGKLLYVGSFDEGKKNGAGITFDESKDTFFVGKYKDGAFLGTGTQFAKDGTMLYVGEYKNDVRVGKGISYNQDGSIKYSGEWFNDVYDGVGVLNLSKGGKLSGNFKNGKAFGKCTLTDENNKIIYVGSFAESVYNGTGRLFSDNGAYAEGRFVDGEPTGVFNEYDSNGKLVYCGEWTDMHRNGRGIEYKNGEKIYEGDFKYSVYDGDGKLFENGRLIYTGTFVNGKKSGFGVEFKDDKMIYQGMWSANFYCGSGIMYENGSVKFAGMFEDGMKNGRINEISNNNVIKKCLYKNDEPIYMCEYSPDGSLLYYGSIKDNKRNGMGCSFMPYCEKKFEGIFKNGEPDKPMKVCLKELAELPKCEELENTEYELYRKTPEYIIEKNIGGGIFTGKLKDGKPSGKGTILYSDHRYTGMFVDGKPDGDGIIYMGDGKEIKARFSPAPFGGCDTIVTSSLTYYIVQL